MLAWLRRSWTVRTKPPAQLVHANFMQCAYCFFFQPYTQISHSISRQNDVFHFHAIKGAEAPVESVLSGDTCTLAPSRN